MRTLCIFFALIAACIPAAAGTKHRHHRPDTRMFPPTREAQLAQNAIIDAYGLPRIADDKQLHSLIEEEELLPLLETYSVTVDPRLPKNRRYCRPWVNAFLYELGAAYFVQYGESLVVTSAVRTERVQRRLLRWNRNAAPVHGEAASSHLAGTTVDISRRSMSPEQTRFMEELLFLHAAMRHVIVAEENGQMCFHIFIVPQEEPVWQVSN